ncbi:MAG: hypothetical protein J3Q66DRAFT_141500 [Benniella sp.]|nr:MAG: hypothetical protein J3Q66DRAFT_141500 [Benniella sp.]
MDSLAHTPHPHQVLLSRSLLALVFQGGACPQHTQFTIVPHQLPLSPLLLLPCIPNDLGLCRDQRYSELYDTFATNREEGEVKEP